MNYYQARISIETARLLEKMRCDYETKIGGTVTKGDCLIKAFEDSRWVEDSSYDTDWKRIHETPLPIINKSDYEVSSTAQMLKIQVTDDVKEGIQDLKMKLPVLIGTRSVTVGVCIRGILKAAYIKNNDFYDEKKNSDIKTDMAKLFEEKRELVTSSFDNDIQKQIIELLDNLESEILKLH